MKGPRTKRARTSYKKKSWKRSYRKNKAAFPLHIVPSASSGNYAFVKVHNTYQSAQHSTPSGAGASDLWQISLNGTVCMGFLPDTTAITQRPAGITEYESLYKNYRIRFAKVKIQIIPAGTTALHTLCQLHTVRGDTGGMTHTTGAGNWNAILNSSKSINMPLLDIGNSYHDHKNGWGFKRVFFPHQVLGVKKRTYINDDDYVSTVGGGTPTTTTHWPGGAYNSSKTAYLYAYVCNSTQETVSPTSSSYIMVIKVTQYLELSRSQNV